MKGILHKEFLINYKQDRLLFIGLLLVGFLLSNSIQIPIVIPISFTLFCPVFITINDDFKRNGTLINSLPVRPYKIVLAKYIYSFSTAIIFYVLVILLNYFIPGFKAYTLTEIFVSFIISIEIMLIGYMFYHVFGEGFLGSYRIILFFQIISLIMSDVREGYNQVLGGFNVFANQFSILNLLKPLSILLIVSLAISLIIAIRSYAKKDF
ncbi:ABC-2 transporter permease [Facklamia sp. 7083-14-GEN3]|uniref:ABC-2 transporter permease n=1 Tax=Facklamia sp. 7083-14-GEN3 TaxID=2973478 RepID=UPI00215B9F92|nr:ABC-2 transporter permease [Facklamia sp. 7083-14-GEN3]MCR8968520.1 ABC-2 transporter permease [Facklamia sp. 7083-14-GEN3]